MNKLLVFFFILSQAVSARSQNVQKHTDELDRLRALVTSQIGIKNYCDQLIRDLDDLSDDIKDEIKENNDINSVDERTLKTAMANAEALENFVRAVGNSSYGTGFLKNRQLSSVRELVNFSFAEIYNGKFCVNIYEVTIGSYKSLVATNKGGNNIVRIKATIKSTTANATTTLELGVMPNEYSRFWSNAKDPDYRSYQIVRIACTAGGSLDSFNY